LIPAIRSTCASPVSFFMAWSRCPEAESAHGPKSLEAP
jgi:hypothetical protein